LSTKIVIRPEVTCPACNHTYAIRLPAESKLQEASEDLAFHCSKCDYLFKGKLTPNKESAEEAPGISSLVSANPANSEHEIQYSLPFPTKRKDIIRTFKQTEEESKRAQQQSGLTFKRTQPSGRGSESLSVQEPLLPSKSEPPDSAATSNLSSPEQAPVRSPGEDRHHSALYCVFALAILSGAFFLFGQLIQLDLPISQRVAAVLSSDTTKHPPAELRIRSLDLERIALESGENISMVKGLLKNGSQASYSDILLEVAFFDSAGNLIETKRAPLIGPNPKRTRLESLPSNVILEMQQRASLEKSKIGAGEELTFQIALSPEETAGASYYTTRVHSVRGQPLS